MDTSKLKKFAQYARRSLIEQVQSKLKLVLSPDSAARREYPQAVKALEEQRKQLGDDEQLVEQVAYTWFNRFCALRFMDVNQYNRIMLLSPISGQFQPEILAEAKAGHLDDSIFNEKTSELIRGLLAGSIPSRDGQAEAFRLMVVAVCNDYHRLMPYLFERIEDYTELLMPDDLLSGNSILAYTREAMTPENCESVESIGWLYQFYISEKKDQVFEGLKKNKKITPENIPAATQLFTPHWIVKYLVENSLGRLWMLNNPDSKVIEQMEYYIKPVEEEVDFLKVTSPEELKVCDSACGSGHMLTYAYDLLYAIYLDANYDPVDIPELILTKNLYGIEIDERAAELAAFALSMKAIKGNPADDSNNRRRFFRNPIKPNICRLEKVIIDEDALEEYIEFAGRDLFTQDVIKTLSEFEEADNFGSLIQPTLKNPEKLLATLEAKDAQVDLFLKDTHESILKILKQAKYLSPIYHVLIANPPYLGGKGMNGRMAAWLKDNYPDVKSDLFSAFIVRNTEMTLPKGQLGFMTPFVWMFISSHEKLRSYLINTKTITSLIQLEYSGFDGATVPICTFTIQNKYEPHYKGGFVRLTDFKGAKNQAPKALEAITDQSKSWFYRARTTDFQNIPGTPIAYWASSKVLTAFNKTKLTEVADAKQGMATSDNDRFLRYWFEVSISSCKFDCKNKAESIVSLEKWYPYNKGGAFRRWYGNNEYVVNWQHDGEELKEFVEELNKIRPGGRLKNQGYYFKENITYSSLSSSLFSARYNPTGFLFDTKGSCIFPNKVNIKQLLSFLNSNVAQDFLNILCPTLDYSSIGINSLPIIEKDMDSSFDELVSLSKADWDSSELSWDFTSNVVLHGKENDSLKESFNDWCQIANEKTLRVKLLEEDNNKTFLNEYELDPIGYDVPIEKISLNCNPRFRFGKNKSEDELLDLQKNEYITNFISYSIGCIFGRYSADKEGLILANQGDTLENYLTKIPSPSFMPDEDNVIPIIDFELVKDKDEYWFEDDISDRFIAFLKATFGEEHFSENLSFIEEAIGKDIKKYFVKSFYADHVQRYKKRPIYWMFSSPKGSFNALIYMHRYQPDTASIVLNDYLREFRIKLEARKESYEQVEISASASQKDKTQAIKAIAKINKVLEEVNDYEHDVLYPLAGEKREIDLDNGVKHNYPLFGKALKKVTGLS